MDKTYSFMRMSLLSFLFIGCFNVLNLRKNVDSSAFLLVLTIAEKVVQLLTQIFVLVCRFFLIDSTFYRTTFFPENMFQRYRICFLAYNVFT